MGIRGELGALTQSNEALIPQELLEADSRRWWIWR
jgi:hypothetical protein